MREEDFLAIIPARAGSKRVTNKNLKELGGRPLLEWTVQAAMGSKYLDKIVLSTDSDNIANAGRSYGAEVPFMRPKALAQDDTPTMEVIKHMILTYEVLKDTSYKYVVLLQPTSPLRSSEDIDKAIELLKTKNADGIISVCETEFPVQWCNTLDEERTMHQFIAKEAQLTRSQDLEKYYRINGAIYIARTDRLLEECTFYLSSAVYAYEMKKNRSIDIDDEYDFLLANYLISLGYNESDSI